VGHLDHGKLVHYVKEKGKSLKDIHKRIKKKSYLAQLVKVIKNAIIITLR